MRRWTSLAIPLLLTAWMLACDSDNGPAPTTATATPTSTATAPAPNAPTATPDGSGETPAPEPTATPAPLTPGDVSFEIAFPDLPALRRPVAMVEMPAQERFLVLLQEGRVLSFADDPGTNELQTVLDIRERVRRDGNEEGLLGIALDPDFEDNGFVYLYYTAAEGERRSVISRWASSGAGEAFRVEPESELVIMEVAQPFANHNGGQILFGPDGMLYIALGDGGAGGDPMGNGQDPSTLLGSILRINVRGATAATPYRIPPDSPFAGEGDPRPEIWAYGLRNPWRFTFDRATGDMWAGDVGQNRFEEVDLLEPGGNYGWNVMEGFECYQPAQGCDRSGLILPVAAYGHGGGHCSVTGGYVYRGEAVPALRGHYVYADYCSGAIWALEASAASEQPEPVRLVESGPGIASFAEDEDGEIYLLSFDGRIYRPHAN